MTPKSCKLALPRNRSLLDDDNSRKDGKTYRKKSDPSDLSNRTNLLLPWIQRVVIQEQMVFQFSLPHCIDFKINFEL